jgi:hypothetical protein
MKNLTILIFFFLSCVTYGIGQNFNNILVDETSNGKVFPELLKQVEAENKIDFLFEEDKLENLTVTGIVGTQKLKDYLQTFLKAFNIIKVSDNIVFIIHKESFGKIPLNKENFIVLKRKQSSRITVSGQVIDGKTNEPLIGAKFYSPKFKIGEATNVDGRASLSNIPQEMFLVEVNYVGYEPMTYIVGFSDLGTSDSFSSTLFPRSQELETVTITAQRIDQNVISSITGVETMSIKTLKNIPAFLGEVDPIRSLTTLPGVSTVGELASGFNVRGGEAGQNMILQDGAPIYNPSHLFGFFSSFNPDMVNNVTLYKGGGPANYGGRISSVLDISLKNGNDSKHTVTGGIGLVSSRLAVEGPIVKNKSSYMLGGRISYASWLVNATENIQLKNSSAKFNDITAKFFHTLNENNILTASVYRSYDDFKFATDSIFSWGTLNIALKWDHTFNEKVFSTLTTYKSSYFSAVQSINEIESFKYRNSIDNVGLKYEVTKSFENQNKILFGVEGIGTKLEPGKLVPDGNVQNVEAADMNDQYSLETSAFIQGDFELTPKLSLSAGLRYSIFQRLGPEDIYIFDFNDIRGRYPNVIDTVEYDPGQNIKTYSGLEPRVSLRYLLFPSSSIKVSFYRGYQYLHLISNTTSTTPQDYWISSGPYLKPQIGDQFSAGYFQNLNNDKYETSVEGFYKTTANAVDYIEGADIVLNPSLEAGLMQGHGLAYGLEVFLKKKVGKLNGWIAYTYSRSLRKFDEENGLQKINDGSYYASSFDQPNRLSVIANYYLTPRVLFSANFNFSTGRPITIPVSKFSYDAYLSVLNYSERNEYRIPDYHRLDISLSIKENPLKKRKFTGEWTFSIFNLYGRNNAYSVYFDKYGNAKKLSVMGSVFPSITYSFHF